MLHLVHPRCALGEPVLWSLWVRGLWESRRSRQVFGGIPSLRYARLRAMACWVVYLAFRTLWQTSPDERWFEVDVGATSGPGRVGCTVGRVGWSRMNRNSVSG